MADLEWQHLVPLVAALEASGNAAEHGTFRPNQGGWSCVMAKPLDFELLRPLIAADPHASKIRFGDDEVACLHCWANILGAEYIRAVRAAYLEATSRRK